MRVWVRRLTLICIGVACAKVSFAQTAVKIGTEAVDNFAGCPWGSLSNNQANVNGLYNGMTTTSGISWKGSIGANKVCSISTLWIGRKTRLGWTT